MAGDEASGADRRVAVGDLVQVVNEQAIDVLALQEVDFDQCGKSWVLETLTTKTPLRQVRSDILSPSAFFSHRRSGVAVASCYPVTAATAYRLPNPDLRTHHNGKQIQTYDKGMLMCTVEVKGHDIYVASLHSFPFHRFDSDPREPRFRNVWRSMASSLSRGLEQPLVVAGDFNTANRDLITTNLAHTLHRAVGNIPTHRGEAMDDILYSDGFTLAGTTVVPNFSDHHLCVVELAVA